MGDPITESIPYVDTPNYFAILQSQGIASIFGFLCYVFSWSEKGVAIVKENHHLAHTTGRIRRLIQGKFSAMLHHFEVCLAVISVVFVVLGVIHLLREIPHFSELMGKEGLHQTLEELFSDILLLVVGVELAIMLVRRTPESLIEVIFFVIARKMLIKTGAFYELLIGVIALAGLFAVRKYLIGGKHSSEFE
jgi:hypothetical protein